jgi:hypothetical protein
MERLMSEAWPYLLIAGYAVLSLIRLPLLLLTNKKRKIDAHRNEA